MNKKFVSSFFSFRRSKRVLHLLCKSGSSLGCGKRKNMLQTISDTYCSIPFSFLVSFAFFCFSISLETYFHSVHIGNLLSSWLYVSESWMSFKVSLQNGKIYKYSLFFSFLSSSAIVNGRLPHQPIYLLLLCFNDLLHLFFSVMFSLFGLFAGQMRRSRQSDFKADMMLLVFIAIRFVWWWADCIKQYILRVDRIK